MCISVAFLLHFFFSAPLFTHTHFNLILNSTLDILLLLSNLQSLALASFPSELLDFSLNIISLVKNHLVYSMWRVTLFIDTTRRIFLGLVRKKKINKTFANTVSTNLSKSSSSRERRVEEEFLNSYQLYNIVSEYCHNWKSISNLQIKVIYNWCLVNAQRRWHTLI